MEQLRRSFGREVRRIRQKIKAVKPLMDERGINFGYHNHADEFRNGDDKVFELMRDVDGLTGELDIYWATAAGLDPVKVMEKYGKRLTALHIKDMDPDAPLNNPTSKPNAVIGEGKSHAKEAFDKAKEMGLGLAVLEVEFFPCDPEEYLTRSRKNMAAWE
ncbi:MAG: sugar phosphate isomerase/epimerase family protein [Christensenellales bacterium]